VADSVRCKLLCGRWILAETGIVATRLTNFSRGVSRVAAPLAELEDGLIVKASSSLNAHPDELIFWLGGAACLCRAAVGKCVGRGARRDVGGVVLRGPSSIPVAPRC
jgi:hypothetical protein